MKIFEKFQSEIDAVANNYLTTPTRTPVAREEVLGTIEDEETKRLFTLIENKKRAALEGALRLRFDLDSTTTEQVREESSNLANEANILAKLFWMDLRIQKDLVAEPHIGLRDGWKIVKEPSVVEAIDELLTQVLGV